MGLSIRTFLIIGGEVKRIGVARFSRINLHGAPEFAGLKIPYVVLAFENEGRKLGELRYQQGSYFVFDAKGNVDRERDFRHAGMVMEGLLGNCRTFAARRAKRLKEDISWSPTGEQLRQMIDLVKKKA